MNTFFFFLIIIFFIAFVLGLIKPSIIKLKNRKKVLLFTFLPFFLFIILWGAFRSDRNNKALENPELAEELSFYSERLTKTPEILKGLKKLKKLNLNNNNITELDSSIFLTLENLEELDLTNNPIKEFPSWLLKLKNLKKINLDETNIETMSESSINAFESISYDDTPFSIAQKKKKKSSQHISNDNSMESESLGEFALRKLTGNEHGYKLKFKKGEVYYIKPVKKGEAQKFGEFMEGMGYFTDEKEVSIQLNYNTTKKAYEIRFVVDENMLDEDTRNAFKLIGTLASSSVFDGKKVLVLLCDDSLETLEIL